MTLLLLAVAVLLIAACGVFVAAEFSLITVNRSSVERMAAKGDKQAQGVVAALKTLSTQLSGAQVGITITNLAIGLLAEPALAELIRPGLELLQVPDAAVTGVAIALGIALATIGTMVFGELVPKNLAIARPLGTAKAVVGLQRAFSAAMKYPIKALNGSANAILHKLHVEPQEELASARSADELTSLVRRSAEQGTLPKETALMLERSMIFDALTALDVMTPRIRMKSLSNQDTAAAVLALAKRTGLSRFPVEGKNQDDIVGVVHVKKAMAVPANKRTSVPVSQIMAKPLLVPSSIQLDSLLDTLRSGGLQMAIVIDEFGGTDGLVTMEDLLEELVGEVHDEHDQPQQRSRQRIRQRAEGVWVLSALLRPDEVTQYFGMIMPEEEDFETLGGLVAHRLERVPVVGDVVGLTLSDHQNRTHIVSLEVERMDGRRVDRIKMELLKSDVQPLPEEEAMR
ncbi:MAG TPA: hemolysin family protein [Candidatus Saccharimonadales bacterium]|nr:hemolysin family protein [Candidatus Saccharimonadales bacterium]